MACEPFAFCVQGFNGDLTRFPVATSPVRPAQRPTTALQEDVFPTNPGGVEWFQQYMNFLTGDGFFLAAPSISDRKDGTMWPFFRSEPELNLLRSSARLLFTTNPPISGLFGGIASYVISTGMRCKLAEKPRYDVSEMASQTAKAYRWAGKEVIDEFDKRTGFRATGQNTAFIRSIRDGDSFIRLFPLSGGYTDIRFRWPELIRQPPGTTLRNFGFGVRTCQDNTDPYADNDVAHPLAFADYDGNLMTWEEVPTTEMVWIPNGAVPGRWEPGVRRGLPDPAFGMRELADTAYKLIRNCGGGLGVRQAFAYIRQWDTARLADVQGYVASNASYQQQMPYPWPSYRNVNKVVPGMIEDIPSGRTFAALPENSETGSVDGIVSMLLRTSARAWNVAEWLATGSGSGSGGYTSEIVHESTMVRTFEAAQGYYAVPFDKVYRFVLDHAIDCGRLPLDFWEHVSQEMVAPSVVTRNKQIEADTNEKLMGRYLKSPQQVMSEDDRDPDQVLKEWAAWKVKLKENGLTDPLLAQADQAGQPQPGAESPGGMGDQPDQTPTTETPSSDVSPESPASTPASPTSTLDSSQSTNDAPNESSNVAGLYSEDRGQTSPEGDLAGLTTKQPASVTESQEGFGEAKPAACTCPDWPEYKLRNGSTHLMECPIHKSWQAAGGFANKNKSRQADGTWVAHTVESQEPHEPTLEAIRRLLKPTETELKEATDAVSTPDFAQTQEPQVRKRTIKFQRGDDELIEGLEITELQEAVVMSRETPHGEIGKLAPRDSKTHKIVNAPAGSAHNVKPLPPESLRAKVGEDQKTRPPAKPQDGNNQPAVEKTAPGHPNMPAPDRTTPHAPGQAQADTPQQSGREQIPTNRVASVASLRGKQRVNLFILPDGDQFKWVAMDHDSSVVQMGQPKASVAEAVQDAKSFAEKANKQGANGYQEPGGEAQVPDQQSRQAALQTLQTAPVKARKPLPGGSSVSELLELEGGKAVWKPADGEAKAQRPSIPGNLTGRGIAAGQLAELWNLSDMAPAITGRTIDGVYGSIQGFIANAKHPGNTPSPYDGKKDLARAAAFDFAILNTDRHRGNWVIRPDGGLGLIDPDLSLPETHDQKAYGESDLLRQAILEDLPIPEEAKAWAATQRHAHLIMQKNKISDKAIRLTVDRLVQLSAATTFRELFANSGIKTVDDLDNVITGMK